MLDADDNVFCSDPGHTALQWVSGFVIVFVAFGLPVLFGVILIQARLKYQEESSGPHLAIARRVAKDMDVELSTAQVRDLSFLVRPVSLAPFVPSSRPSLTQ